MMKRCMGIVLCCLLSGCAWRTQIERGVVSTSPIDFDKTYQVDRSHKVSSFVSDWRPNLWLIPIGSPDASDAFRNAIEGENKTSKRKIVGLAETDVKFRFIWLYLVSFRWYSVEGYPIHEM